ncbi:hypothetical protein [Serratia quinivorans]|uniref:hypothetical protein n=1 Tax=Serratia quinivorans TaxID=137545 RepID=UPI003982B193
MSTERPSLVTTGSTVAAAEKIVAWLKPELEGTNPDQVKMVERHIGQFSTPEDVKRYLSGRDGCIRLAALRVRNIRHQAGGMVGLVNWAAYVMATDAWAYGRDLRAEVMVGKLARRLTLLGAANALGAETKATDITADNIYSGNLDSLGVTIWVVTWNQEFKLDEEVDITTLPDFLRLGMTASAHGGEEINGVINVREQQDDESKTD